MSSTPDKAEQSTDDMNEPNPSVHVPDPADPLASAVADATHQSPSVGPNKDGRRRVARGPGPRG
jgi:hypothetical protein